MKQMRWILCLFVMVSISFCGVMADDETVIAGNLVSSGQYDGDVVVTGYVLINNGDLTVFGDLKITGGYLRLCNGSVFVDGDLIVTEAEGGATIVVEQGSLEVTGAIITYAEAHAFIDVRNPDGDDPATAGNIRAGRISTFSSNGGDAYIVADQEIVVTGAIVAKALEGHAFVASRGVDPEFGGYGPPYYVDIRAGAIFTHSVSQNGDGPYYDDECNSDIDDVAYDEYWGYIGVYVTGGAVYSQNGHVIVNGPIVTYSKDGRYDGPCLLSRGLQDGLANANVYAHGNLEAASVTTHAIAGDAYVSAEKILVNGDIRTDAQAVEFEVSYDTFETYGGRAYVEARASSLEEESGTFEDIKAQNIYTKGSSNSYVQAFRNIDVKGDIVTWETGEVEEQSSPPSSAFVLAGFYRYYTPEGVFEDDDSNDIGWLKAQNVMTKSPGDAYVRARGGIDVTGEIITHSVDNDAYVYTEDGDVKAGNIATTAGGGAYVLSEYGNIDVTHVINTKSSDYGISGFYASVVAGDQISEEPIGDIRAEKIFTYGESSAYVEANNEIHVKGPVSTRSVDSYAYVDAGGDIVAGAISTYGANDSQVESYDGSIDVVEDVRAMSDWGYGHVRADYGNINARSIRTEGNGSNGFNKSGSIEAAPGSAMFQLIPNLENNDSLLIGNGEFDLDSDHDWNIRLDISGSCTLNGKGHVLTFGELGEIVVGENSTLYLQNITIRNVEGNDIRCYDSTGKLVVHNVTFELSEDYYFSSGELEIMGDFHIKGFKHGPSAPSPQPKGFRSYSTPVEFSFDDGMTCLIHKNSTLIIDHGVQLEVNCCDSDRIVMVDSTSRIHFDASELYVIDELRLTKGTLVFDNEVKFSEESGGTIYFGDGADAANNLTLDFHEASKLIYDGSIVNENV